MSIQRLTIRIVLLSLIATLGCKKRFPCDYPTLNNCVFTIPGVQNFDCWILHQLSSPQPGQRRVKLRLNVVTYYADGCSGRTILDDQAIIFDPNVTPFPVSVTAKIPTNKPYEYEFNVQSEECTECALGHGGGSNQNPTACNPGIIQTLPNGTLIYNGAVPRWQRAGSQNSYLSAIAVFTPGQIDNVPRTCGCGVSDH
jgi:hypothetical protein